jgi:(p)ppGpp synthase/HD superfamily hydrolase
MGKKEMAESFAYEKHYGQLDDNQQEYIKHPIQVANIVKLITDDEDVICAAYLHDTIENTKTTYQELKDMFGYRIADLVLEVTHEGNKTEGYTFPRLHSREAILIKFADRLSNLSRMETWSERRKLDYIAKSSFWKMKT